MSNVIKIFEKEEFGRVSWQSKNDHQGQRALVCGKGCCRDSGVQKYEKGII